MTPQQQVDHLKDAVRPFLAEARGQNGGFSLEGLIIAFHDLEQSLNIHDCQDPGGGCSCAGGVRFPV